MFVYDIDENKKNKVVKEGGLTAKNIFLNSDVDFDKSKDDIKFKGSNENN